MSNVNDSDSAQLGYLRKGFCSDLPGVQATAYRLGKYTAGLPIKDVDYGAHSKRWISLFKRGHKA